MLCAQLLKVVQGAHLEPLSAAEHQDLVPM